MQEHDWTEGVWDRKTRQGQEQIEGAADFARGCTDKQKQARREEDEFLEKAVGMEVEKETDESVIVNVSPEFTEPGMT